MSRGASTFTMYRVALIQLSFVRPNTPATRASAGASKRTAGVNLPRA
jgi:hypothetical protein